MTLETRDGRKAEVTNVSADEYRLSQLVGRWLDCGLVCCRLGIPCLYSETTLVRLSVD